MTFIGKSIKRVDAKSKVTGKAVFPGDINLPNQAYMKILFAGRPHAIIKSIDYEAAKKVEGVLGIFTSVDVPVNEYGLTIKDQPVLCGPGSSKKYTDRVRFIGDQVAIVIADTVQIAEHASKLIKVDFEDLPAVTNFREALEDKILLHPDKETNIYKNYKIRKGNIEDGFENSDVIIENEYITPVQEHAYLAPESGIAYFDEEERITVAVAGQWIHEEQEQIAHALDLPAEKIRIIHPAIGGAFGGREDMSVQIVLALAVKKLDEIGIRRPVKIIWSREESIIGHHKRHQYRMRTKWGATKEGKILAAESEVIADSGAYNYTTNKVLGNSTVSITGPYEIPNVKVDAFAVYTNNIPGGAFRGFGSPQPAFAAEMQMNKLAEALDMDPIEIRMKNIMNDKTIFHTGTLFPAPVTMDKVLTECAKAGGWELDESGWELKTLNAETTESHKKRGKGISCGFKNIGFSFGFPERCWADVEIQGKDEIEKVIVRHAAAEVGQGAHTVIKQMAAEATNVPIEKVQLILADTAHTKDSGSSSASRITFMAGKAIIGASELALKRWKEEDRPARAEYKYVPPTTTPLNKETGESMPNFAYGYVAEVVEVEVDTETGVIKIIKTICANDVGKAINPKLIEGQIEGAVVQAAGYTILENFIQKDGYVQTKHLSTYLIPTVYDMPDEIESIILEYADKEGPWGVRGMGEMPFIPFAPAVVAAVHDATGVWFDEFPLTPERVLRGLREI